MNQKWLHTVTTSSEVCRENLNHVLVCLCCCRLVTICSNNKCSPLCLQRFKCMTSWHIFSLTPSGIWLPNSNVIMVHQFFKHTQGVSKVKALKCNERVLTSVVRCFLDCILSATGSAHTGLGRIFVQLLFMRLTVCRFSVLILSQEAPAGFSWSIIYAVNPLQAVAL